MRFVTRGLLLVALATLFLAMQSSPGWSQEESHTFPETGHTVKGTFWQYWQSHGGLAQQGYPISEQIQEKSDVDGKTYTVQYFERAVFEMHPENAAPYNVLLSLLGTYAYQSKYGASGAPNQQPNTTAGAQTFPETHHTVGGLFLTYWQQHGGLAQQGYPISDEFSEKSDLDGKTYTVQYFERAVFEMHPENAAPYNVLLSQLGTQRYQKLYSMSGPPATPTYTAVPAPSGDWPMYGHDPQRTNYNAAETTISASNVAGLTSKWQAHIDDVGHSSSAPVVANGRVFVGGNAPNSDNFFAFDAATGAKLWSVNLGYKDACFKLGIGSTAAVPGNVVVVGGGDGAYYGLDATTGAQLWRDATAVDTGSFAWTSPLISNGKAVFGIASYCDDPQVRGQLRSVDAQSGQLSANRYFTPEGEPGAPIWNSPALSPDGSTLVVATGEDQRPNQQYSRSMVSLDAQSLEIKGSNQQGAPNQDLDWGTTPVIFHDAQGRTLVAANHKNKAFYVYDLAHIDAGPLWEFDAGIQIGLMPAYDPTFGNGGTLFMVGAQQMLYASDPSTGDDRWDHVKLGNAKGNIALANHLIYANVNSVGLVVLDETTGKTIATLTPDHTQFTNSGPTVSNGTVYWMSGGYLNAWSLPAK